MVLPPAPVLGFLSATDAAQIRVRDAANLCHDYHMNLAAAEEIVMDVARGDEDASAIMGMHLNYSEAQAVVQRLRADFALLAKDESDCAELARDGVECNQADKYKARLLELYREHNPEKLSSLDSLLQKYEGKEAELYRKVCEKYEVQNADYPIATFVTTEGIFKAEIYLDRVPLTASNFIDLAQTGFYNGIHIHRTVPGFMNQFGCPHARDPNSKKAGTGNPPDGVFRNLVTGAMEQRFGGGNIKDEYISKDSNRPGTLSMANSGYPNSGGSQFFVNVRHNTSLDWFTDGQSKHLVFGKVIEGYDICKKINAAQTSNERPLIPIRVNTVTISNLA
eukprot:TRINITY_DN57636_c0_g1_i1.p1 TRINITY_DN57636_c0_g1~~TRINITY_DN57636_c0_g1_i1.p1  ORF type:complete len:347 (+),score=52.16 TRINITY_DN57636_c0_g1_i1:35-1042(+)